MKEFTFNKNNLFLFFILFICILPILKLGRFELPVLYLLMPLGGLILTCILFGWLKIPKITKLIILLFFLILIEITLSTLYGTITVLGSFVIPTDAIQYVARFLVVVSFISFFYQGKVCADTFIKYFLIFLNIAMLIGILQWVPWPGREFLVKLYPFYNTEYQLAQLNNSMSGIRVHGIAQHATANGGLASFFFVFGFSILRYYKRYQFLSICLMVLSILNLFASQARAGMLALVFAIFLFYIVSVYINRKSIKPTLYVTLASFVTYFVVMYLYKRGNPIIEKMVYRWEFLIFEEKGGARVDQFSYFLSLLKTPFDYLFGFSKQVVNRSSISFGIEIEPANILVTYGLIGFLLQYSLVIILLIYFFKNLRRSISNKASLALIVAAFVGLASYQVFSLGYYFYREIRVGLFPWILIGVAIGVFERYKKQSNLIITS